MIITWKKTLSAMEFRELVQGIKNIVEELKKLNSKIDKLVELQK